MPNEKTQKNAKKYCCEKCLFVSGNKTDYNRHLLTAKHKILINPTLKNAKNAFFHESSYFCNCGKHYQHHSSLCAHRKKCRLLATYDKDKDKYNDMVLDIAPTIDETSIISELKNIIIHQQTQLDTQQQLCKQQQEQIGELIPRIGNNTITNNTTQNNKFNIKVFLDEKCKDAINMTDFVNSIKVSLEQLDYTKQYGLADGLSKTIMENMNRLTLYERPLHCTDVKRETLYIKDDDKWSKDNSRERMKRAIKGVTNANYRALKVWQGVHPDLRKDDRLTDYFTDTIVKLSKSLDGIDDKVLKNICRSSYLKLADIE